MNLIDLQAQAQNITHSSLKSAPTNNLDKKAKEFEAVYLNQLMQSMFSGLQEGGTYGSGPGSDAWRSMLLGEYANQLAQSGGIGLAETIKAQMLEIQEANQV
ncbi:rod-binding protein [Polycladidibacter hongkongensis]|uniref:rod-binding protein n=1 Tax=Polycladidibacter hongkongensis TaxID=1647556 RepID=UPI0009E711EF|nr:rod-binding protein [Pseudovibrio hongkongensis]